MHLETEFGSLLWIVVAAALGPILAKHSRGWVPDAVWLLVLGLVVGPAALGLAEAAPSIDFLAELGLGLLFLLAGFELNPSTLRSRQGAGAAGVWLVSMGLAVGLAALLFGGSGAGTWIAVGLALTSTALGTLLPILSANGVLRTPMGSAVLVHGAVGEIGPVVAMALLLSGRSLSVSALVLVSFVLLTLLLVVLPGRAMQRIPGLRSAIADSATGTSQTVLRMVFVMLVLLMFLSVKLHLDVVLGAFTAGMLLRAATPQESRERLEMALQTVGFAIFIPVFFVTSGMGIEVSAVIDAPLVLLAFIAAIALLRGLPIVLAERWWGFAPGVSPGRETWQVGLYGATGLPVIVAVTALATDAKLLTPATGSLLVTAGACTVLIFPAAARMIGARAGRP